MNGAKKFHKPTGPAFHEGQLWVGSGNVKCWIVKVEKYPNHSGIYTSDYEVTYKYTDGKESKKDAWNFQVRYQHIADFAI